MGVFSSSSERHKILSLLKNSIMALSIYNLLRELEELSGKKAELNLEVLKIQEKISAIHNQILNLEALGPNAIENFKPPTYSKADGVPTKMFKLLAHNKACLTVREIVDMIKFLDGRTDDKRFDRDMITQVAFHLKRYFEKKQLRRFPSNTGSGFVYGLEEWFDENGQLIESYNPNKIIIPTS